MAEPDRSSTESTHLLIDTEHRHVAQVYAQAFLAVAEKQNVVEGSLQELELVVREVVEGVPRVQEFLRSGVVNRENKEWVLRKALEGKLSAFVLNFLLVVNRHHRLDSLRAVLVACREIDDERHGRLPVEVTSAVRLGDELAERIRQRLREVLQKEPILTQRVDPRLLGGMVVRVGDRVYDGSVATQVERLREQILKRSVHEIQSRRNRFSDSTGN